MPAMDGVAPAEQVKIVAGRDHGEPKTDGVGVAGPFTVNDAYEGPTSKVKAVASLADGASVVRENLRLDELHYHHQSLRE